MNNLAKISEPFLSAVMEIKKLEKFNEYVGAFVFGSVARGEQNENSDLDVKVITNRNRYCENVNHPYLNGVKLDLGFNTIEQLIKGTEEERKSRKRIPMIAESIILFDKVGLLGKLKKKVSRVRAKKLKKKDYQWSKFMLYHAHDKACRHLESDPASAMLSMGIDINDVLKDHYKINGKWWLSNKRMLRDLDNWDPKLANLIRKFALSTNVNSKYKNYLKILNHVSIPMGDWSKLEEDSCECRLCAKDLALLGSKRV